MARHFIKPARARRVAARLTGGVIVLHGALLLTLWLDPVDPPRAGTLWQLLWASARRPSFYVLLAVMLGAPALTALAWQVRGRHRRWLVLSWAALLFAAGWWYAHRLGVMLRILYERS